MQCNKSFKTPPLLKNKCTPPLCRDINWRGQKGKKGSRRRRRRRRRGRGGGCGELRRYYSASSCFPSSSLFFLQRLTHVYVHTHSSTGEPQSHTLTAPSRLFLAVYWAIFRPLPVSSHLEGRECSQYKGTGLTLWAYVSASVSLTLRAVCGCECVGAYAKKLHLLLICNSTVKDTRARAKLIHKNRQNKVKSKSEECRTVL